MWWKDSAYTANHSYILYYYIFVGSAEKCCDVFTDIIIYKCISATEACYSCDGNLYACPLIMVYIRININIINITIIIHRYLLCTYIHAQI